MKKNVCMAIFIALCLAALTPAMAESDVEAVNALYQQVLGGKLPLLQGNAIPYGRVLIAVYELGNDAEPKLSCENMDEEGYHGIPKDRLASGLADAQTVILVYPRVTNDILNPYVNTTVCVVDMIRHGRYESWQAARKQRISSPFINRGPGLGTLGGTSDVSMDVDKAMEDVILRMEEAAAAADERLYRQAEKDYGEKLYYTARQEFLRSLWGDWNERAADCIQSWPENGKVWETDQLQPAASQLTIQVNQPEDSAFFARLYKDGKAYVGVFVAGTGAASVHIPSGEYAIKAGSGDTWYGGREVFGREASYQYLTFDEDGTQTYHIQSDSAYTLSINVTVTEIVDGVGSEPESWENVVE